jgi:hypothetical protein
MCLLAGLDDNIVTTKKGKVKDRSWGGAKKQMLGNIKGFVETLKKFKDISDAGNVPDINWKEVRPYLLLEHFNYETIKGEYSTCLKCKYDKYDKDKHVQTRTNMYKHVSNTYQRGTNVVPTWYQRGTNVVPTFAKEDKGTLLVTSLSHLYRPIPFQHTEISKKNKITQFCSAVSFFFRCFFSFFPR